MAGIGFELKKIYRKEGIARSAMGVVYSTLVTIGPMILVICSILFLYFFLGMTKVPYAQRELLSSTILYTFIFSVILTAPFNVTFSRYLADKFYAEEYEGIIDSYYAGITILAAIATLLFIPMGWSLRVRGNVDYAFIFATYVQWIALVILFFSITYLHATKDYKIIALFFGIGMAVSILLALAFFYGAGQDIIYAILFGLSIGFLLTSALVFSYIRKYFHGRNGAYGESVLYLWRYKSLVVANLFYILGLYVHNFVFWTVPSRTITAATYYSNQSYDMASCLAMFTNISVMVLFTVMVETRFHSAYKEHMEAVIGGTYKMIEKSKKKLFRTLTQQIGQIFGIQIAITSVIYLLITSFGTSAGIDSVTLAIYPVLTVAFLGVFMMYGNLVYLYYFSDMTGAAVTGVLFFGVTLIGSLYTRNLSTPFWGAGIFVGMIISWTYSFFRIRWIERNLETYIFCDYKVIDTMKSSQKGKVVYSSKNARK